MRRNTVKVFFSIGLFLLVLLEGVQAQFISNAQQTAFAGGGTSSLIGPQSMYLNPANLMINGYGSGYSVELANLSLSDPFFQVPSSPDDFLNQSLYPLLMNEKNLKLGDLVSFSSIPEQSTFSQSHVISLMGLQLRGSDWAFGFSARNRSVQNTALNNLWYADSFEQISTNSSRHFSQQSLRWNEMSVNFSRSVDYIEGLSTNLNKIYFGITASYLRPLSYHNLEISEQLNKQSSTTVEGIRTVTLESAGQISGLINQVRSGANSIDWENLALNSSAMTEQRGWGAGISVGFTYEIPFESNYSKARKNQRLNRVIRFSGSVTDIGFIEITKNASSFEKASDTLLYADAASMRVFQREYTGSLTQSFSMLTSPALLGLMQQDGATEVEKYQQILPTQLHSGISLQYDWILLGADVHYGLNSELGNEQSFWFNGYSEISILPFLPIRGGALVKGTQLESVSAGLGLNLWFLAFDAGVMIPMNKAIEGNQFNAIAGTGLRIRF